MRGIPLSIGAIPCVGIGGMGLSGIRDRVNMLQGALTIASRPGKGTSIQIEFPRVTGYRRRLSDRISY